MGLLDWLFGPKEQPKVTYGWLEEIFDAALCKLKQPRYRHANTTIDRLAEKLAELIKKGDKPPPTSTFTPAPAGGEDARTETPAGAPESEVATIEEIEAAMRGI